MGGCCPRGASSRSRQPVSSPCSALPPPCVFTACTASLPRETASSSANARRAGGSAAGSLQRPYGLRRAWWLLRPVDGSCDGSSQHGDPRKGACELASAHRTVTSCQPPSCQPPTHQRALKTRCQNANSASGPLGQEAKMPKWHVGILVCIQMACAVEQVVRMLEIGCLSWDNASSSHQVTGILDAGVAFSTRTPGQCRGFSGDRVELCTRKARWWVLAARDSVVR